MKIILFVILVFVVIGVIGNLAKSGGESIAATPTETIDVKNDVPLCTLTSTKLGFDYASNAISADQKYENGIYVVKGTVDNIDYTYDGCPYIRLRHTEKNAVEWASEVVCYFDKSYVSSPEISRLKKGNRVAIKGVCNGLILSSVMMKRCCF